MGTPTVQFRLGGPLAREDLPQLCERMRLALTASGADLAVCDVQSIGRADAVAIDALARLQLTARRLGCRMRLQHASTDLRNLLAFVGLDDVLLRLDSGREAEEREQLLGVEEERELDDPPA